MGPQAGCSEHGGIPEPAVRAQLGRILASRTFTRSERLASFLRFVVERALEGNAASLKEQVLVGELYGRGPDFDTRVDPVVRVDARRLRDKLREYYEEHPDDPVIITIPKGTYAPKFQAKPARATDRSAAAELPALGRPIRAWGATLAAAIAVAIAIVLWPDRATDQISPPKVVPLTAYPGDEGQASLSPDGKFVTFACTAPQPGAHSDICVKAVGTELVQRLTDTPQAEYWPAWSPDSSEIVFGRSPGGSAPGYQDFGEELGIFIVSRMGGPARRISDTGSIAKWRRDGKALLIRDRLQAREPYSIFELDLTTRQRRRITQPGHAAGDWLFEVSPDGQSIAFIRVGRPGISNLYIASVKGGEPRRITDWNRAISGVAWMPDSKELIYTLEGRLWRIPADPKKPGRGSPIPDIAMQAAGVSISRLSSGGRVRLAFSRPQARVNLQRVDLASADKTGVFQRVLPFAPATRFNSPGHYSPDGRQVTFVSDRSSADMELWVANSDGSSPRQLTFLGSTRGMLAGSWSPDGTRILFDTAVNGNHDVYVISADGGDPVRLTTRPGLDLLGDWSKDGRWIYYASEETAPGPGSNLWRIPSKGGPPEQITAAGGFDPQFGAAGDYVYYFDRSPLAGKGNVMRMPSDDGASEPVISDVSPFLWCVTPVGIYFARQERSAYSVHVYRFEDEKIAPVGLLRLRLAGLQAPGRLSVSPDGRWALVNVREPPEGDLMLLENFR